VTREHPANAVRERLAGWKLALVTNCQFCGGSGSVSRASYNTAHLTMGAFGFSTASQQEVPCGRCLSGFVFAPLPIEDSLTALFEELITYLEDPKNSALRKRFLDLNITDVEIRLGKREREPF
jgi:hypothetical protein